MLLPIAQLGQPVLRRKAAEVPVEEIPTPEFQQFLVDMLETMTDAGGIGLAAPQVFVGKRVFLAGILPPDPADEDERPGVEVFINPRIVAVSEERIDGWEGCLSFIELQVLVSRRAAVIVDYLNRAGEPTQMQLVGFRARVVQHELDHLDGILTIDRAASTRDIVKQSEMDDVLKDREPPTTPEQ
jgi:peptide deformylase